MEGNKNLLFDREFENQITRFKTYDKDKLMEEILFFKFRSDCKKFKCGKCNKKFTSKQSLVYHLSKNVCSKLIEFKCNGCEKKFASKQKLNYHIAKNVCKKIKNQIVDVQGQNNLAQNKPILNIQEQNVSTKNPDGYVYLLQLTDTNTNEHFYKIGKTNRTDPFSRIGEYTPGYKMLFIKYSINSAVTENKFLDILRKDQQIEKYEYGREYFISATQDYIFNLLVGVN